MNITDFVSKFTAFVAPIFAGFALSASAATPFTPSTVEGIHNAVAEARAAWQETSEPQEIIVAPGTYKTSVEIVLDFPVVFRGATGNPADVIITKADGATVIHRKFTVDHADARLESVTVAGAYLTYTGGNYSRLGAGVRISKATFDGGGSSESKNKGAGGTVSNCVFTANTVPYKNSSAIVYVNGPADKTLVTCCVITNNSVYRQTDSNKGDDALGSIVHVDSGRFTSSIVGNNQIYNNVATDKKDETSVVEARGGSVENCLVIGNQISKSFDPTVIRVLKNGRVFNTVLANNSIMLENWSREDWPETSRYWAGVAGGFTNCVVKGVGITMPNETCFCVEDLGFFSDERQDYRLTRSSPLRAAAEMNGVLVTGKDLLGNPRVNSSGLLDIGPVAYDPEARDFSGETVDSFNDEGALLRVLFAEGFGDAPMYFWTVVRADGETATYLTAQAEYRAPVGVGEYAVTLSISNLAAGVGASLALGNPLKVYQRRFYAKSGNPTAAAPYATEETAAADLQTAIDAVTQDGAEVIALRGVYEITSNILVKARQITLRGETGNPEDVIVRNTTTAKWLPSEWDERKSKGEGRCLVLDAGPASRVESMTFENGKGLYAVDIGCGLYLGDWNNRGVWPAAGKGGVVSNCVVRNCSSGSNKYGITPGIFANGPYLITHTVVTNCTSGSGNSDGGRFCGVGLDIGGGARAEHCLIAGNRDSFYKEIKSEWPAYGRGIVGGVMVRDNSSIRFSTVAGNRGTMIGGVNVNGSQARVENCIILNNTIEGDILACAVTTNRFACWGIMTWDTTKDLISGTTKLGEGNIAKLAADEIASVAEHPEKVDAAFVNCITDLEVAGLTGLLSSGEEVFRNAANRDYRLRGGSPALDRILPEDAGTMPEKDLLGNPRLHGARYDLGCYECISTGLMMLFR